MPHLRLYGAARRVGSGALVTREGRGPGRPRGLPRQDTAGCERLLRLFREFEGDWIELPAILRLGVAQYNARIKQLRDEGFVIENRTEWRGRVKKSWFRFRGKT